MYFCGSALAWLRSGPSAAHPKLGRESRFSLSAIVLKRWRVPSTFNLVCFLTIFSTCSHGVDACRQCGVLLRVKRYVLSIGGIVRAPPASSAAAVSRRFCSPSALMIQSAETKPSAWLAKTICFPSGLNSG